MIARSWRGWTSPESADAYESLLKGDIIPGIEALDIPGFQGIELWRLDGPSEVEFVTTMWFDSIDALRMFAGEDYETAVVPPRARALLSRFEGQSRHYTVEKAR